MTLLKFKALKSKSDTGASARVTMGVPASSAGAAASAFTTAELSPGLALIRSGEHSEAGCRRFALRPTV